MDRLIVRFQEDLRLRGRGEGTLKSYTMQMQQFYSWHDQDLQNIGVDSLKEYLATLRGRKLKSASIIQAFAALTSFCDFMVAEGKMQNNPVPPFRKRYLQQYKSGTDRNERRCISVDEASRMFVTALASREQAIIVLLAKTGMRVHELSELDICDVNMQKQEIRLKPTPKRSNRTLFFDDETERVLRRWLAVRAAQGRGDDGPPFTGLSYTRLYESGMALIVVNCSRLAGVGDPALGMDYITPHYFRVFFTTHLLRSGMPRHYVQELRGDSDGAAIDIYTRIDREELRRSYLAHVPQLGV